MQLPPKAIFIIPAVMMAVAVLPMPYGYYQFLRLVTVVAAGWIAAYFWSENRLAWASSIGCVALLFNPVFRISLDREMWAPLNIIAAALLLAAMVFNRSKVNNA